MEGCLPDELRPLQTAGHVLWPHPSLATFQTMMNNILKDLIDEGHVAIYMDDILIYTQTIEHHWVVVTQVLDVLRRHQLYLKAEKCSFECSMVEYLGLVLSEGRIEMDPVKIAGI